MSGALRLGFIPLNDCAPLAVAAERGFFADEGLSVELTREPSWANIRDKLAAGAIEGAHMLAPMAVALSFGIGSEPYPTIAPMALARNGSAVTLSRALVEKGRPLAEVARARREAGQPLRLAVVFPYSVHNYELRDWLTTQGIDPEADVRIVVVPPPRMGEQLFDGRIDGFCAGEPWNALAVAEGCGLVVARAADLWPGGPDKVLGVSETWASREGSALFAVVRALTRAAAWADANHAELAALLARPAYVGAPQALIAASLKDIVFGRGGAGRPGLDDGRRCLDDMRRWGQIEGLPEPGTVFRPDLYDAALA